MKRYYIKEITHKIECLRKFIPWTSTADPKSRRLRFCTEGASGVPALPDTIRSKLDRKNKVYNKWINFRGIAIQTYPALRRISRDNRCAKAVSVEYKLIHFNFFQLAWTSAEIYSFRCSSSHLFLFLFLFSFETRGLRGDRSFHPEPLRIPPLEDIEFLDELQTQISIRFKSLKNDKTVLWYRYFKLYKTHNADGKGFFSKIPALETVPSDQKSNPCTCTKECHIAFKSKGRMNVKFSSNVASSDKKTKNKQT